MQNVIIRESFGSRAKQDRAGRFVASDVQPKAVDVLSKIFQRND